MSMALNSYRSSQDNCLASSKYDLAGAYFDVWMQIYSIIFGRCCKLRVCAKFLCIHLF
jgi:hypothetical protein